MTEDRTKPFSTGGFFLVQLAMFIPLLNIILLLVFALSGSTNVNLQNWSRAMLIFVGIGLLITILGAVLGVTVFGAALAALREALGNIEVPNGVTIPQ
jgi:uncharacterized integral membrane protein